MGDETCQIKTKQKTMKITESQAAIGRDHRPFDITDKHAVNGNKMLEPFPENISGRAMFGMGCFWSTEHIFYNLKGVYSTQVGYAGGITPNPIYEEVKDNLTGHIEVVRIIFDEDIIDYTDLLQLFWESHNPTQGMRQGIDWGSQYQSTIFVYNNKQKMLAMQSRDKYQQLIDEEFNDKDYIITTEIIDANNDDFEFYYAEDYHQQYFHKHPETDCSMKGLGVSCPVSLFKSEL